jgi:hypothetical protein
MVHSSTSLATSISIQSISLFGTNVSELRDANIIASDLEYVLQSLFVVQVPIKWSAAMGTKKERGIL